MSPLITRKLLSQTERNARYFKLLKEFYNNLQSGKKGDLTKLYQKNKCSPWVGAAMIKMGLISRERQEGKNNYKYTWLKKDVQPNLKLAQDIAKTTLALSVESTNKVNKPHRSNTELVSKTKNPKSVFTEKEKKRLSKIKLFLDNVYSRLGNSKKPISAKSLGLIKRAAKYKLDSKYSIGLQKAGIIEKTGDNINALYRWTSEKPSDEMAFMLLKEVRGLYYDSDKRKRKTPLKFTDYGIGHLKKSIEPPVEKAQLWKNLAKKFIDLDDPEGALKALDKL